MKKLYLLFTLGLLLATSHFYAQNDTLYVWKAGIVINKQSVKTVDVDSIIFYKPTPIVPITATVTIGTQTWTTKNLDVTTYRDGTPIPQVTDPTVWAALKTGAWCYYNNDAANGATYGKLYNWYAVAGIHDTDPNTPNKTLAPVGYHISTDAEWNTLTSFLGGESVAGNKMKATTGWTFYGGIINTNSSGFNALPGGFLGYNGFFTNLGNDGIWWSASEFDNWNAWYRALVYYSGTAGGNNSYKENGFSVRCLAGEAFVAVAPTVTTTTVTAIATTSTTTGGNVTNAGGSAVTARGVVWSTSINPTIALTTKTVNGTGTGIFVSSITGLTAYTTYYVRAYATNSGGTSYGNEVSFKTTTTSINPLGITTAAIPAGTFVMGSPTTEPNRGSDEVQHSVTLSAFSMSTREITCAQYSQFANANNIESNGLWAAGPYPTETLLYADSTIGLTYVGSDWVPATGKTNAPMVYVSWFGAASFAQYASGRLPTEAEWEYAARATTTTAFNTGACLSNSKANYNWQYPQTGCTNTNTNLPSTTQNVGTYAPNAWGLYDMHGNVGEWCSDWYGAYSTSALTNPTGPTTGFYRVLRGGSWGFSASGCRSAPRGYGNPGGNIIFGGFRIVF